MTTHGWLSVARGEVGRNEGRAVGRLLRNQSGAVCVASVYLGQRNWMCGAGCKVGCSYTE